LVKLCRYNLKQVFTNLSNVCIVVISYQIFTILLIAFCDISFFQSYRFLSTRIIIIFYLFVRIFVKSEITKKYGNLSDSIVIYVLLAFFYRETAQLNTYLFSKIDPFLCHWDQLIFGFQPSVRFSEIFSSALFSEFMFFGYFSYYLMPPAALLIIWRYRITHFSRFSFLLLSSYFIYYLIFIILPAEGPQFYFPIPLNLIDAQGPFAILVKLIQKFGEAPTAAFPSSHVGIMIIILILLYKIHNRLFKILMPLSILLLFSTIYIKAHYFVDVIAGLLSAPIVLIFNHFLFLKINSFSKTMVYADRN